MTSLLNSSSEHGTMQHDEMLHVSRQELENTRRLLIVVLRTLNKELGYDMPETGKEKRRRERVA
jgi:hypothetical protein